VRHPDEKPAEALQRVDRLLYQAKEGGRGRILKE
jgi:PleD family two-component response regulator